LSRDNKLQSLAIPDILKIKTYQPGKPVEEVKRELGLKKVIKLASNENPLGPSIKAVEAIKNYANKVNFYPDGGSYYLKKALAEKLGVEEEKIILGNGSLNNFKLNLSAMAGRVSPKTKLIFISNPNNPTGTIVEEKEVKDFLRDLPGQTIVIFDEAYFEYVENKNYPRSIDFLDGRNNVVILRTFSKIYGLAGLRIGYGIAQSQIIEILNRARPPFNVNSLAQVAALASLRDEDQITQSRKLISQEKKFLYSHLEKLKLSYIPTQANFILIKIGKKAPDVEKRLLEKGIIVRGMEAYNLNEYIRLTIGTRQQNEEFVRALGKALSSI